MHDFFDHGQQRLSGQRLVWVGGAEMLHRNARKAIRAIPAVERARLRIAAKQLTELQNVLQNCKRIPATGVFNIFHFYVPPPFSRIAKALNFSLSSRGEKKRILYFQIMAAHALSVL
jgi:hypothetical protein